MLENPKYGSFLLYLHIFSGRCSNQDLAEENKAVTRKVPFYIELSFSATTFWLPVIQIDPFLKCNSAPSAISGNVSLNIPKGPLCPHPWFIYLHICYLKVGHLVQTSCPGNPSIQWRETSIFTRQRYTSQDACCAPIRGTALWTYLCQPTK